MTFAIKQIGPQLWSQRFSSLAHESAFGEKKNWDDRIDYALLSINENEEPCGYVTCRELDSKIVRWQYGGMFEPVRDTIYSMKIYEEFINWMRNRYEAISFYVENTNKVMLKFAMKSGFLITGIRNYQGNILLEHLMEFKNGN